MIQDRRDRREVGERHLLWLRWCRTGTRHRVIMITREVGTEQEGAEIFAAAGSGTTAHVYRYCTGKRWTN